MGDKVIYHENRMVSDRSPVIHMRPGNRCQELWLEANCGEVENIIGYIDCDEGLHRVKDET